MSQDMKKLCNVEHVVLDMNGRIVDYNTVTICAVFATTYVQLIYTGK